MQDFNIPRGNEVSTTDMLPQMGLSYSVENTCREVNTQLLQCLTPSQK